MLSKWNPFNELWNYDYGWQPTRFQPAVDVYEEDGAILLKAEVPGLKVEDVKIDVHGNMLTLSGERKVEKDTNEKGYRHVERSYGSFTRSFTLPDTVDSDGIEAALHDGILTIKLPKSQRARPRNILVRSGRSAAQSLPTEQQKMASRPSQNGGQTTQPNQQR